MYASEQLTNVLGRIMVRKEYPPVPPIQVGGIVTRNA